MFTLRACCGSTLATALAFAPAAVAQEAPPRALATLEWQVAEGADGCLTRDLALRATSERVGRPLFARSGAALKVVGTARAKRGGGFRVTLDLSRIGGQHLGRRTLETDAEDCSALDEAVVLALVLMLDFVDQPSVNPHGGGQSAPKSTEIHIPPDAPGPTVAASRRTRRRRANGRL